MIKKLALEIFSYLMLIVSCYGMQLSDSVINIISFIIFFLFSILSIVFGVMLMNELKK
jgi:hypothetical protein